MNEYTRSNAHTQILRTVKDFPRILELNSPSQKWRAFPEISARLCQPFTVFRSNVPFLNAMARILVKLSSKRHRLKPFEFSPHGLSDRLRLNCEPSSPMNAFSHILSFVYCFHYSIPNNLDNEYQNKDGYCSDKDDIHFVSCITNEVR